MVDDMLSHIKKINWSLMHKNLLVLKQKRNKIIPIDLNDKIDEFLNWYLENVTKKGYTDNNTYNQITEIRNFIEKMAVWYELRYPDYEIYKLMPGFDPENIHISDVMFKNNKYINEQLDGNPNVKTLAWDKFFNTKTFIDSLPWKEKWLLQGPRYSHLMYIDPNNRNAHLHLNSNGIVQKVEKVKNYTNFKVKNEDVEKLHVEDVVKLLKENGIVLPNNSELEQAINNAKKWAYQKEEILNCVMYRIIQRGGNRIGPRRALLFAKEFQRDINIPMKYGIDYLDPWLKDFINEYIKADGSKDLICYVGYFSRSNKKEKVDTISIQELIQHNYINPKENNLHQGMDNALASPIKSKKLRPVKRIEKNQK